MKSFLLEPKKGIKAEAIKIKLEEFLGKGHVILRNNSDKPKDYDTESIILKEGSRDMIKVYRLAYPLPDEIMAFISDISYNKLINPATKTPVVPKSLSAYLESIKESEFEAELIGEQG